MLQTEKVTISSLRQQLQDWKVKFPEDLEVPLEIQQQAKLHGSRHGYRQLAKTLKIDFEKLFSKVQLKNERVKKQPKPVKFTKVECSIPAPSKDPGKECLLEISKGSLSVKIFHLDSKVLDLIRQMVG